MKYEKSLEKIITSVTDYRNYVDELVSKYETEKSLHNKTVADMRGVYTDSYIEEFKASWQPNVSYGDLMKSKRNEVMPTINHYILQIEKEMDQYFNASPRTEFVNKINSIALTGMKLTNKEFELLKNSASNYMEMRLLSHLAESRTKQEMRSTINDQGYSENKVVEVENPYTKIELPDIDRTYTEFERLKNSVKTLINFYAGSKAELKDYLGDGVSQYVPLTADSFFRNKVADTFTEDRKSVV